MNTDWLIPDWPAPPGVHAVCTTRAGGCSAPPFASFNLGEHVGDQHADVARNRAALARALDARPVFLNQVHGTRTCILASDASNGSTADAALSTTGGLVCTVMVADCLPVLLSNQAGTVVAAAHAGWRGLLGAHGDGILESVVQAMCSEVLMQKAQAASELIAWLGPCIGPQAFEVGAEVREAFVAQNRAASALFQSAQAGKWRADLPGLARQRLAALGVRGIYGNDGGAPWCTVANPSRFFSFRRDGVTGRMGACIWLA